MPEEAIDGVLEDGRKFTRSLLHMTPLKDGKVSGFVHLLIMLLMWLC